MRLLPGMNGAVLDLIAGIAASCGCDASFVDTSLRRPLWRRRVGKAAVARAPRSVGRSEALAAGPEPPSLDVAENPGVTSPDIEEVSSGIDGFWPEFRELHDQHEELMVHHACNTFGSEQRILDHRIVPLRNFAELRAAGRRMCNHLCVADPEFRPEHAWFLMLDGEGWAVAMFRSLSPADRFDPGNMYGLCDEPVPGSLEMMAKLYLWHEYCLHTRAGSGDTGQHPGHSGTAS